MASATQSPEQRELALIGKVEMRIALADTDNKLEAILKTYLPPILLKLASEHVTVRNKVISVCQHITTRTKPSSVQLPVAALVKQFQEQESSFVRHFDLLYIQQGVGRLSSSEKAQVLPVVLAGISKSGSHGPQIFNLLLRLLESFTLPPRGSKEDSELRQQLGVSDADAGYVATWIGKFILFTPQKGTSSNCPGLSSEDYAFISMQNKDDLWSPASGGLNLLRTKVLAARLLSSGLFNDQERFLPAMCASADPASTISDVGDDILKRAMPVTDLEDEALVRTFFYLYFGVDGTPRVRPPLRLKILGLLNKSTHSTTFSHFIMQIVDDGVAQPNLDGDDTIMSNSSSSISNAGREITKLRAAIFQYVDFVARYGSVDSLHAIAPRVITRLRDFIENQGWPKTGPNEDIVSRGYAYEVVGLLAKAGAREVLVETEHASLDLVRWLFESLAKDSTGTSLVVSIEEALSTVLSALSRIELTAEEQAVLEDLLTEQMHQSADLEGNQRLRSTRYVSIRFANRCLPYSSIKARWVDVLGLGATNDRGEVREEAERGLSPYWYGMLNGSLGTVQPQQLQFPTFDAAVKQLFSGNTTNNAKEPMAVSVQAKRSHPQSFSHMTAFARHVLYNEAMTQHGAPANLDSEWERRIDAAAESDETARSSIRRYVAESTSLSSVKILASALFTSLTDATGPSTQGTPLVELLSLCPDAVIEVLLPHTQELMPVLQSNNHSRRMTAAHVYGLLSSHLKAPVSTVELQLHHLEAVVHKWDTAIGAAANQVHGCAIGLGYYYSRKSYRTQTAVSGDEPMAYLKNIVDITTSSKDSNLLEAAHIVLGQMCMFGAVTLEQLSGLTEFKMLVDKVYDTAKSGNETAVLALGQLSMVLPEDKGKEDSDLSQIEEAIHKLHEIKQAEAHFAVGEAFSYIASGWQSSALATKLDIIGEKPSRPLRSSTLAHVVDRVLSDCGNTKPALKKAAVIWLLCLVQFCGHQAEVQDRLGKCQIAFKRCLGDRDELVQESASRGLGLIYEKGDRRLKDDLVRDLVSSFSSDRSSQLAGNVSADTQLFEPGALPTGEGSSVSTYKDIMSLASEVGDSSLVYRFMSMASSNAIWSSRAAFGRFGLSNVLSDSSVDGYLANNPKLYPKLFRYRFDPNSGVQRSMNDIWNALVKDSAATIDQHFDAIMDDLLVSIVGKEWRTRQASCAAVADLVQGRSLDKYDEYLERIWTQCFKVLDDIKESVRAAAASLARVLTGVLTRALEADHSATKNASAMLKHVLPFLLSTSGMESGAQEVQGFSVSTLLEIIKKANGSTLRPFIPELVERLVGSLSTLEPEAVNYLHLNASKYNLTEQKIDDMRLSSIRSSPLMEAIERCLDLLDEESMQQLQPKLESAMKSAVGLPSKVGSSRVLVSLSTRRLAVFRPHADYFLRLIEKVSLDRNDTVSSSYAVAAGYLARAASDKQFLRLMAFAKRLYFDSEGDREAVTPRRSILSGEITYAVTKHAADRFNALASSAMPFVFIAKHDQHEQVKEQFQNAWDEVVGGTRAVALYLSEIVSLSNEYLDSPQWVLKHTSARAIADAATLVATLDSKQMSPERAATVWAALEKAIGGKTWDGKEVVLAAFSVFVQNSASYYSKHPEIASNIVKITVREAKRQNPAYQPYAIKVLGEVALARTDVDLFQTVFGITQPLLEKDADGEAMDVDGERPGREADELRQAISAAAAETLLASVNVVVMDDETLVNAITQTAGALVSIPAPSTSIRRSIYSGLKKLFDRVEDSDRGKCISTEAADTMRPLLFGPDPGTEALNLSRAAAIISVVKAVPHWEVKDRIRTLVSEERSAKVRGLLQTA
ncbi:proteasome component M29 [Recurvomyces mirabilis]|uniref:Proteasome component M29 n=1 Tax=Recurvomyces mirabilis TaxID=574656 RepID=A0AAE0TNL5_9PEZI|nr:proteasome component M29 [Recurvomyces mirabilis]KAK5149820.1 proteasome component M29 [Recurvomyces mirabilis]